MGAINLAAMSKIARIRRMSAPMLVQAIRRVTLEATKWRLLHEGKSYPQENMLHSLIAEAKRRNITINHPELDQ